MKIHTTKLMGFYAVLMDLQTTTPATVLKVSTVEGPLAETAALKMTVMGLVEGAPTATLATALTVPTVEGPLAETVALMVTVLMGLVEGAPTLTLAMMVMKPKRRKRRRLSPFGQPAAPEVLSQRGRSNRCKDGGAGGAGGTGGTRRLVVEREGILASHQSSQGSLSAPAPRALGHWLNTLHGHKPATRPG